jgi:hypothetical protein
MKGRQDIVGHRLGVAAGRVAEVDPPAAEVSGVDVVHPRAGGPDEAHGAPFQEGGVDRGDGTYDQGVRAADLPGRHAPPLERPDLAHAGEELLPVGDRPVQGNDHRGL